METKDTEQLSPLVSPGQEEAIYSLKGDQSVPLRESQADNQLLLIIGSFFSYQQNLTSFQVAQDQQQETTLKTYLDDMSTLLLSDSISPPLHQANIADEIRKVARAKTLIALESLDAKRKGSLVLFLLNADLITWHNLSWVDLSGDYMANVELHYTNLSNADLSNSVLSYTNLSISDMHQVNLSDAVLHGADLHDDELSGADLSGAWLNCDDPAQAVGNGALDRNKLLTCPNLNGADLSGANLTGVDLTGADLKGAIVTAEQFATAKSLRGATMPDGSIHP